MSAAIRGHVKLELLRELAMEAVHDDILSARYGVSVSMLQTFKLRYADAIADIRLSLLEEVVNETAGLWIAYKAKRIAEYQEDVELINSRLPDVDDQAQLDALQIQSVRAKHSALKSVAEELAQLPTRSSAPQIDENVIHYSIVGSSTEGLKGDLT